MKLNYKKKIGMRYKQNFFLKELNKGKQKINIKEEVDEFG